MDCLYVQYRRKIFETQFSDSVDEVAGLDLSVFRTAEEMVGSTAEVRPACCLPVFLEILVFEGGSLRSFDEYETDRLDLIGNVGIPYRPSLGVRHDEEGVPHYLAFIVVGDVNPVPPGTWRHLCPSFGLILPVPSVEGQE